MTSPKKLLGFGLTLLGLTVVVLAVAHRGALRDWAAELGESPVPSAMPYPSATPTSTPGHPATLLPSASTVAPAPTAVNLDIPFVSQAPHQVWDEDHEEFCEEAAALMVASYVKGDRSVTNIDTADAALYAVKDWEMRTFGYFKDTTAAETARIIREHFGVSAVAIVANPSEAQLKAWVAAGKAVIVPTAGRKLGNPNFTGAGPLYHMVVLKGYTAGGQFITNDSGTRKGADYIYAPSVILNAMHDWNGGDVDNGAKVVIVVG